MCACHSIHLGVGGSHVTIIHDALDLTVRPFWPQSHQHSHPPISDMSLPGPGSSPPLVTSGGHYWRPVQTCSLEDPPNQCHLLTVEGVMVSTSGQYASYWNDFLFSFIFIHHFPPTSLVSYKIHFDVIVCKVLFSQSQFMSNYL